MDAISLDLRLRILSACDDADEARQETAQAFGVSRSFVQKLLWRDRHGEPPAPRPRSGGPPAALDAAALDQLGRLVRTRSDATLEELSLALAQAGGPAVSVSTIHRALCGLDLPLKKSRCTPANATRLGCGRCGAGGGTGRGTRTRPPSCLLMRAGPARP